MNESIKVFLSLSFSGAFLILVLFLLKPLLKNKFSKQWQYYIWLIVVIRLLLPFTPETSLMGTIFHQIDNPNLQVEQLGRVLPQTDLTSNNLSDNENANGPAGLINDGQLEPKGNSSQSILLIIKQNIWTIWLMGAIALLIRKITIYQSFVKYIKAGKVEITDIELWEQFGKLVEQSGIKMAVGIYTNSLISSPLLIGFFRPCIMLPTTEVLPSDFRYTILHELTHYKRRDMFYKWLVQLTICVHWFNPFVYLMGREINRACELSCDETVLAKLSTDEHKAYGNTLLNALEIGGNYKSSLASVTLNESKELLKERLDAIMNFKKKSRLIVCTTSLLTILLLCGFTFTGAYASVANTPNDPIKTSNPIVNTVPITLSQSKYTYLAELKADETTADKIQFQMDTTKAFIYLAIEDYSAPISIKVFDGKTDKMVNSKIDVTFADNGGLPGFFITPGIGVYSIELSRSKQAVGKKVVLYGFATENFTDYEGITIPQNKQ